MVAILCRFKSCYPHQAKGIRFGCLFSFGKDSSPPCKSSVTSGHGPAFADREGKRQFPQGLELELEPTSKRDTASELTLTNPDRLRTEGR